MGIFFLLFFHCSYSPFVFYSLSLSSTLLLSSSTRLFSSSILTVSSLALFSSCTLLLSSSTLPLSSSMLGMPGPDAREAALVSEWTDSSPRDVVNAVAINKAISHVRPLDCSAQCQFHHVFHLIRPEQPSSSRLLTSPPLISESSIYYGNGVV